MIPRIIHQTWKTAALPADFATYAATWEKLNPTWTWRFWTDRDLLEFVAQKYPEYLELYCRYPLGVQRADLGRYLLLHHFGGVYADMDAECLHSLEPLSNEDRLILCEEPPGPATPQAAARGFDRILFNGVMASPAGHPFWPHLLTRLVATRHARNVLDATGPYLLTGAVNSFTHPASLRIEGPRFFHAPAKTQASPYIQMGPQSFACHHQAGTWWQAPQVKPWRRLRHRATKLILQVRSQILDGPRMDTTATQAAISRQVSQVPYPRGQNIAILVPVRDASQHLPGFLAALDQLAIPKKQLKLVFCEGDSRDDTFAQLESLTAPLKANYREVRLLRHSTGTSFNPGKRWLPAIQRARRAGLARVRNHLIDQGLDTTDDWALWMDIDVWRFPADIIDQLLAAHARIIVPNCVTRPGGPSFDQNSFLSLITERDHHYFRQVRDGLFQPPAGYPHRLHLSDLRHSERVPLHGVGGTMLLVDAGLHRSGLRFPEIPYDHLIETEGLGQLARDCGITPIGLPRVEILHVPW